MPQLFRGRKRHPDRDRCRRTTASGCVRRILEGLRKPLAQLAGPRKCGTVLSCLLEIVGRRGSGCNRALCDLGNNSPLSPAEPRITGQQVAAPQIEVVDDHIQGLDPMVVAYLERSELFLRNYTKIDPSDREDLDDSRALAKQSLKEIAEQKELAGNFAPVRITLDQYENVLREIKNLNSKQELTDVQTRILSNGLIANMKAYQPQVMLVSRR